MTQKADKERDRPVVHVVEPVEVMEGAGVMVRRAIPSREVSYDETDPFLLLDDFDTSHPSFRGEAFPRHPHRGFEIITYLLSGAAGHADDLGNESVVRGGGLQKITAGSGMWHEEGPVPGGQEPTRGLQLWINLARKDKKVPAEYQAVEPEDIPVRTEGDARVRVLVGDCSPTRLHTPTVYLDVSVPPKGAFRQSIPIDYQGFLYVLEGKGTFGSNRIEAAARQFLTFGLGEGLSVAARPETLRFVLGAGLPHREPIRWNGPFVD